MNILLDSSIIIDALRQNQSLPSSHHYYISDITITELYSGKSIWESKKKKGILDNVLIQLTHLPTSSTLCQLAGKIRAAYYTSVPDAIIAATAIENKLSLATLNTKDFSPIPHLKLIKI